MRNITKCGIVITFGLVSWAVTWSYVFAGGLEEAAIRAVDRSACNFQVDQRIINSALYVGALERNLTNKEAFDMAVQLTATLQQQVQESGRVRDYCIARMGQ